jgi:hypothetical protein
MRWRKTGRVDSRISILRRESMEAQVRDFEPKDWEQAWQLARVVYPELYAKVTDAPQMIGFDKAWVVEVEGRIVGFAFCLGQYVSDVAVLLDEESQARPYAHALLFRVLRHVRTVGGVWSATCREETSYRLIKGLESKKRLRILREEPAEPLEGQPRTTVWFELLEREPRT